MSGDVRIEGDLLDTLTRLSDRRHAPGQDAEAVSHHYGVGNGFYAIDLGPSRVYSWAFLEQFEVRDTGAT